jgi:hypothetical protein
MELATVPTLTLSSTAAVRLTERALLVGLNIREWRARCRDREVTHRIVREHGAKREAGCFTKSLVPRSFLARIGKVRSEARDEHHRLTLPWCDDGLRILPVDLHLSYLERIRALRAEFQDAVSAFLAAYEDAKEAARTALGALYRGEDYPSAGRLRKAFGLEIHLQPLPTGHDWRIDLPDATVERIRTDLETRIDAAHRLALADLYGRMASVVSHMATTLAEPDKIFRNSLVDNVRDLCRILPALNVARDPALTRLTEDVEERLARLNPWHLRHDPVGRQRAADTAADLLETITSRLGSYTGATSA